MIRTSRRALLVGVGITALLMGCNGQSVLVQIQQDIETIAEGLAGAVKALTGIVPQVILDKANAILAEIEAAASLVVSTSTTSGSVLTQISDAISALATLLTPFFPAAPMVATAVQAAIVLIELVLNLAGVTPPASMAKAKLTAPSKMTPAEARGVLINLAKRTK